MEEEEILRKARKRVRKIKGFYTHLTVFLCVITFLIIVNYMTTPDYWWVVFPAAGWGLTVLGHYFAIFGFFGLQGKDWEEKTLQKEMERIRRKEQLASLPNETFQLKNDHLELKEKIKGRNNYNDQDLV